MFNDDDFDRNGTRRVNNKKKLEEYDYIIHLNRGKAIIIGAHTEVVFLGIDYHWGEQVRFALQAPDDISILRLELFARRLQIYDKIINVRFGEKISVGSDLQICLLPQPNIIGQVYIGINSKKTKTIKKSLFNQIAEEKKST